MDGRRGFETLVFLDYALMPAPRAVSPTRPGAAAASWRRWWRCPRPAPPPATVRVHGPDLVHDVVNRDTPENRTTARERNIMKSMELDEVPRGRMAREIARERRERALNDELRARLGALDDLRGKDARERADTCNLKRGDN